MKSILQVFFFDLFSKALWGVLSIFLIRYMPQTEYAQYTFALSLILVVTQTLAASFNRIYIVGYKNLNLDNSSLPFLGFQLMGIAVITILAIPLKNSLEGMFWFIVAGIVATCLSEFSKTAFQQELKFMHFSSVELFRTGLFFLSVLALIYIGGFNMQAWQVLSAQASAMLITFLIAFGKRLDLSKLVKINEAFRLAIKVVNGNYKFLFGYFLLLAVFSQIDIFMLKTLADDQVLATYASAYRYYSLLLLSLGAIHAVLLPKLQHIERVEEWNDMLKKLNGLLLFFIPIVLLGAFASQWIIPWIDRGKYPEAILVFRILSVSAIVSFAFSPYVNLLMRFEDFKFLFILVSAVIPLTIGGNGLLIPKLHATGTAITTLISFCLINGSIYLRSRKYSALLISSDKGDV